MENHIIQCKINANANISNIKPGNRFTSTTRKLHEIGRKFSQTWQGAVVSRINFRHSYITQMSNVILEPILFNVNRQQMTTGCTTNFKVVQPIVSDGKISYYQSWTVPQMAWPIARPPSQSPDYSRDLSAHNHARLMVRPCTTGRMCDKFATSCDL